MSSSQDWQTVLPAAPKWWGSAGLAVSDLPLAEAFSRKPPCEHLWATAGVQALVILLSEPVEAWRPSERLELEGRVFVLAVAGTLVRVLTIRQVVWAAEARSR
jgi:hypothetical protein